MAGSRSRHDGQFATLANGGQFVADLGTSTFGRLYTGFGGAADFEGSLNGTDWFPITSLGSEASFVLDPIPRFIRISATAVGDFPYTAEGVREIHSPGSRTRRGLFNGSSSDLNDYTDFRMDEYTKAIIYADQSIVVYGCGREARPGDADYGIAFSNLGTVTGGNRLVLDPVPLILSIASSAAGAATYHVEGIREI